MGRVGKYSKMYALQKCAVSWKDLLDTAKLGIGTAIAGTAATGIAGGYALSRGTSPGHLAQNTENEVVLNTLRTELAKQRALLAEDERRAAEAEKASGRPPYDRFLS